MGIFCMLAGCAATDTSTAPLDPMENQLTELERSVIKAQAVLVERKREQEALEKLYAPDLTLAPDVVPSSVAKPTPKKKAP